MHDFPLQNLFKLSYTVDQGMLVISQYFCAEFIPLSLRSRILFSCQILPLLNPENCRLLKAHNVTLDRNKGCYSNSIQLIVDVKIIYRIIYFKEIHAYDIHRRLRVFGRVLFYFIFYFFNFFLGGGRVFFIGGGVALYLK